MTTEIMKSFSSLQDELEKAKDNLKAMDEHIKKLTGRDPGDMQTRLGVKRPANAPEEFRGRGRGFPLMRGRPGARPEDEEAPAAKKRPGDTRTVFSRLSGPTPPKRNADSDVEDELPNKPAISSRVIATPKEPPSRQEAMAAQSSDQRSHERNRRMFGALLGTLQKFRQEETRMKEKEEKRAKVERKLEENAKREKEELKRERQELFLERKRKQAEIRKIELKMLRIKEQDEWEVKHRHLLNFIQTRAKPHIFYLPKVHTVKTEERLVASQKVVAKMIEKKRAEVRQELEAIERRGRWRQGLGDVEPGQHSDDEQPMDIVDKENRLGLIEGPPTSDTSALNQDGVNAEAPASDAAGAATATSGDAGVSVPDPGLDSAAPSAAAADQEETTAPATATGDEAAAAATKTTNDSPQQIEEATGASRRRRRRRAAHDDDEDDEDEDEDESEDEEERRRRLRISTSPAPAPAPDPATATETVPASSALPQRPRRPPRSRRGSARSEDEDDEDEDDASNGIRSATPPDDATTTTTAAAAVPGGRDAPGDAPSSSSTPPPPAAAAPTPLNSNDGPEEEEEEQVEKEEEKEDNAEQEKVKVEERSRDEVETEDRDEEDDASPALPPVPGEDSPKRG